MAADQLRQGVMWLRFVEALPRGLAPKSSAPAPKLGTI
jgi:hypothetical protein